MKQSVLEAGGNAEFSSEPGEGFEIKISIPFQGGESYETHKSAAG
jgi:hypothetical protein